MEFQEVAPLIFREIKPKLENHEGLTVFAIERAKFEGWLKVELCDSLLNHFRDTRPEVNHVDICFGDWGIELKTINTNLRYHGVKNKHRPITKNTQGVIDDINKLSKSAFANKGILFIAFPAEHDNKYWQVQLKRISAKLKYLEFCPFTFKDSSIPGAIYFGLV